MLSYASYSKSVDYMYTGALRTGSTDFELKFLSLSHYIIQRKIGQWLQAKGVR